MQGKDWPQGRARTPDALATKNYTGWVRVRVRARGEEGARLPCPHPSLTWSPLALSIYFNLVQALGPIDLGGVPSSSFPCVQIT